MDQADIVQEQSFVTAEISYLTRLPVSLVPDYDDIILCA